MTEDSKASKVGTQIGTAASNNIPRSIAPFTGGAIIFLYAFFWPESYGRWLGTIVHSFRSAAGF